MMRSENFRPRHNTLEAIDHTFGFFIGTKRGFNILECVEIEEKKARKRAAMHESYLKY